MTELSFLVDLLLNHRLPKATREAVAARIKLVEEQRGGFSQQHPAPVHPMIHPALAGQAPSTIAALQRHPDLLAQMQQVGPPRPEEQVAIQQDAPQPVAVVAQTQATAAALASRQQAIAESIAGKVDKVNGRPRKW